MADEEQTRQIIESFKLLFDRPNEPLITPKGDKKALFQLTEKLVVSLHNYLTIFRF